MLAMSRFGADDVFKRDADPVDDLEQTLREKIYHFIALYLHANALFLAERLVAHNRSEANIHLLATCYFRGGHVKRAISVLQGAQSPENRYLLAACCFQTRQLVEAENALLCGDAGHADFDVHLNENVPKGAAGLYLLGRICRRTSRREQAIQCFIRALEMDSTLWSAYEELCDLGANIDAPRFFGEATCFDQEASEENTLIHNDNASTGSVTSRQLGEPNLTDEQFRTHQTRFSAIGTTPQDGSTSFASTRAPFATPTYQTPNAPVATPEPSYGSPQGVAKKPRVGGTGPPNPRQRKAYRRPLVETDEKQRCNTRLSFSSAVSEESPGDFLKVPSNSTPVVGRLFQGSPCSSPTQKPPRTTFKGQELLLRLLCSFGTIYQRLGVYLCQEALEMLEQLPLRQQSSGWALHQKGRAYFELSDYKEARETFQCMFRQEPHRMAGLDLYSTTLWLLKSEAELSHLAQQVTELDKLSPEACCVTGNCFSLQNERDLAIVFFQRALQLDPFYTYAYTLAGHEYFSNDDFDKALSCFRHAIRIDPRHYNAWYGLARVYERQEKHEFAEFHARRALNINPRSTGLHCCLGTALKHMRRFDEALESYAIAKELQPKNAAVSLMRANTLEQMELYEEALEELERARDRIPRESSVHFCMGRVYKALGRLDEAMKCFTKARYFNPKDSATVKSAIDKINEADLHEDDRL